MTDTNNELARYREAKQAAARSLRTMSGNLQEGSPGEAVLGNLAHCLADHLDAPHRPVALLEGCYDASFGRVHVRPGCRC